MQNFNKSLLAVSTLALVAAPASAMPDTVEETAASSDMSSKLEELDKLGDLRDRGILSDEEFETMKARILVGS